VAFGGACALSEFHLSNARAADPYRMPRPRGGGRVWPTQIVGPPVLVSLATLYAQSRPAMLSRRCITATAGTSLVRDSQTAAGQGPAARQAFPPHEDASSNFRSLTKIPHCCLRRECFASQVAGRPLSPARDRRLAPTPNPTQPHLAPAAACTLTEGSPIEGRARKQAMPYAPLCHRAAPPSSAVRRACVRRFARIRPEP